MSRVPPPAIALGVAGLIPFVYGVMMIFSEAGTWPTLGFFASDSTGGLMILESFGAVILGFMGGCLWGFASAGSRSPSFALLAAAALPALLAFLAVRPNPAFSCLWLAFGYVVLQALDVAFQRASVTPDYWLGLRLPLTTVVTACLLAGALYG